MTVRPIDWDGIAVTLTRVRVPLSATLRPRALEASGGTIYVHGEPERGG